MILKRKSIKVCIGMLTLFSLVGCGFSDNSSPNEISDDEIASITGGPAPIRVATNTTNRDWKDYFFDEEDCRCIDGSSYFVSLKETDNSSTQLMVTLQGGGACWPGTDQCKKSVNANDIETVWFSEQVNEQSGNDWNQLFLPYCDGSIYFGNNAADYDNNGSTDHWHWGIKNLNAGLNLAVNKFNNIEKIFLTGCSAGGYGTIVAAKLITEIYPEASIYILNESGPGLVNPDQELWDTVEETWNFSSLVPDCEGCDQQVLLWYDELLQNPKIKVALFSSYFDQTLTEDFLMMPQEEFKNLLISTSTVLQQKYPTRFKRFLISNNDHCVQNFEYQISGISYSDWVRAFLSDDSTWVDLLE